jgi:hypothetical protein
MIISNGFKIGDRIIKIKHFKNELIGIPIGTRGIITSVAHISYFHIQYDRVVGERLAADYMLSKDMDKNTLLLNQIYNNEIQNRR